MVYIENESALFRGDHRQMPTEVYDFRAQKWSKYEGDKVKPGHWGHIISEADAKKWIEDAKAPDFVRR
jgi:hypothetical protein